jgi:hypothetical protein
MTVCWIGWLMWFAIHEYSSLPWGNDPLDGMICSEEMCGLNPPMMFIESVRCGQILNSVSAVYSAYCFLYSGYIHRVIWSSNSYRFQYVQPDVNTSWLPGVRCEQTLTYVSQFSGARARARGIYVESITEWAYVDFAMCSLSSARLFLPCVRCD